MSLHPASASMVQSNETVRFAAARPLSRRCVGGVILEFLPQGEFRMGQKVMLRLAVKRLSGGMIPCSKYVPETPALALMFTSGSAPRYFVHVCSSRPATVMDAVFTPGMNRSGREYVSEISRSFANDAS